MLRHTQWLQRTLLGIALLAWCMIGAARIDENRVVIGVLTDLNGAYSHAAGQGSQLAVELAAADFQGHAGDAEIEIAVADHENDPEVARQQARRLHEELGADLIIGMPSSAAALGAQQYASGQDLVIIHTGSGTELLTGEHCSANSFHWQYNTDALTAGITDALSRKDTSLNWYVLALDHPFGYGVHEGIKNALAGTNDRIVGKHFHAFGERQFFPLLEEAVEKEADVIAIGNAGAGLIAAIRQAKEIGVGVRDIQMVGVLTLLNDVRTIGLYAAAGLRFVAPYYWDQNEGSRAFAARFRERHGSAPASNHIAVYTATLHYLKAVEHTGSDHHADVAAAMRKMPVDDGITENGNVRADGRMVHDLNFVEVKRAAEVRTPQAYYRILRKLPGETAFAPPNPECELIGG